MTSTEETFDHSVQAWTVGDLRRALDGMPDDLPLTGWVFEEPGGREYAEYVITDAGRHTALTWFADAGVLVHHLQKIAGHGSITTTQRTSTRTESPSRTQAHCCPST